MVDDVKWQWWLMIDDWWCLMIDDYDDWCLLMTDVWWCLMFDDDWCLMMTDVWWWWWMIDADCCLMMMMMMMIDGWSLMMIDVWWCLMFDDDCRLMMLDDDDDWWCWMTMMIDDDGWLMMIDDDWWWLMMIDDWWWLKFDDDWCLVMIDDGNWWLWWWCWDVWWVWWWWWWWMMLDVVDSNTNSKFTSTKHFSLPLVCFGEAKRSIWGARLSPEVKKTRMIWYTWIILHQPTENAAMRTSHSTPSIYLWNTYILNWSCNIYKNTHMYIYSYEYIYIERERGCSINRSITRNLPPPVCLRRIAEIGPGELATKFIREDSGDNEHGCSMEGLQRIQ